MKSAYSVTLIDQSPIAGVHGGSAASSGLLHAITPKGRLIWKGSEGFKCAMDLIHEVQRVTGKKIILQENSIVRPLFPDTVIGDWMDIPVDMKPWLEFVSSEDYERITELKRPQDLLGAVIYKQSCIIDSIAYLRGMWDLVNVSSTHQWVQRTMTSPSDIEQLSRDNDIVILACGASIKHVWPLTIPLPVTYQGGQNIVIPTSSKRKMAILKGEYIVPLSSPAEGEQRLLCGSTKVHMKDFINDDFHPNLGDTMSTLSEKLRHVDPSISDLKPLETSSGIRVVPKRKPAGRLPIVDRWPGDVPKKNVWMVTGLGSRGLIHHALLADWIFDSSTQNDENLLLKEVRLPPMTRTEKPIN